MKTRFTANQLAERTIHRRAVEAIVWGIPAVNYDLMLQSMIRDAKGAVKQRQTLSEGRCSSGRIWTQESWKPGDFQTTE